MLITVPLMIWSARTRDRQPGMQRPRPSIPAPIAARTPTIRARAWRRRSRSARRRASPRRRRIGGHEPDEGGRQHHPLDADVDDAAPLAHDAAQRAERDRGRQLQGLRREVRREDRVDQVADELEDEAEDRDVEQELHQTLALAVARATPVSSSPGVTRLGADPEHAPDHDLGGEEQQDQPLDDVDDLDRDRRP